jgi:hypothetical protein
VIEPVGQDAQRKGLHAVDCFLACLAVGQYPRELSHQGEPAAVVFLLDFDGQGHDSASMSSDVNSRKPAAFSGCSSSGVKRGVLLELFAACDNP